MSPSARNTDGCEIELERSTVLALLLLDAEISRLFHHEPTMRYALHQIPSTSSEELFTARDATRWKHATMRTAKRRPFDVSEDPFPDACSTNNSIQLAFPEVVTEFGLHVLLERIGCMAGGGRDVSPLASTVSECERILLLWLNRYQRSCLLEKQARSLKMLWHAIFMLLNMDMDTLECAAGRDGVDVAAKHFQAARTWAHSSQARICLVHAIMVQRQFEGMSMGARFPIHAPTCLYRCGIVWYCYLRFGNEKRAHVDEWIDMPELEPLGLDGSKVLQNEIGSQGAKSVEKFLLRTIDLLQRIDHWQVAGRLASTLVALVDEHMGLT